MVRPACFLIRHMRTQPVVQPTCTPWIVRRSHDVREWAIEHGKNPLMRIVLAGYDGEHDMPSDWRVHEWQATGGYALSAGEDGVGRENARRGGCGCPRRAIALTSSTATRCSPGKEQASEVRQHQAAMRGRTDRIKEVRQRRGRLPRLDAVLRHRRAVSLSPALPQRASGSTPATA